MSNTYINSQQKYQFIPRNKNPYLPPLPFKRPNYNNQPNINFVYYNKVDTPKLNSRSYSASNIGFNDNLYNTKIQKSYVNNILLPKLNN